jgi:molybdenum cofactor biosynthesis enzyme MoaA
VGLVDRNRRLNADEIRQGKTILGSTPLQINFELIGYCNIVPPCLYCSGKNHGYNYAPLDAAYLDGYSDFIRNAEHLNEDSFGEPLMHKKLTALARTATSRGQRFSFVSNGLLLSGTRAQELAECGERLGFHVSLNAATPEMYYKLHGQPFDKVLGNVERYIALYQEINGGLSPDLVLTFIVMRVNRHEIFPFLELAQRLRVRPLLAQLHDRPSIPLGKFGYDFVYENEMLSPAEYFEVGEHVRAFARERGMENVVIQWDPEYDSAVLSFHRDQDRAVEDAGARATGAKRPAAWNYSPQPRAAAPAGGPS